MIVTVQSIVQQFGVIVDSDYHLGRLQGNNSSRLDSNAEKQFNYKRDDLEEQTVRETDGAVRYLHHAHILYNGFSSHM